MDDLKIGFGISFEDLYSNEGLKKIDEIFLNYADEIYPGIYNSKDINERLEDFSKIIEDFVYQLFNIKFVQQNNFSELFWCKRNFIQRIVTKLTHNVTEEEYLEAKKNISIFCNPDDDEEYSSLVKQWMENKDEANLEYAKTYSLYILKNAQQDKFNRILYYIPKKIDHENLLHEPEFKLRTSFSLLDNGCDTKFALDQTSYCIFCHNQGKDSCSKGLFDKSTNDYKTNTHGTKLKGCPLEEHISEMNMIKSKGFTIAPLAIAMINNPLLAATGHRICNDCMKACIYQKQEPVDIPQIETRVLKDVLELDYGVEIYSLLSRWNPLNLKQRLPKDSSGYNILVVGMGPAGFNASHHLINAGHNVLGIDGLKIEPLNIPFKAIKNFSDISEDLAERSSKGFGGVAEYGITVRWNKNFLTLIRLLLERRNNFRLIGGVRFGSTIKPEQAKSLGFDHVVLAVGAGKPNIPEVENILARGARTASDFLMSLQLNGAFRLKKSGYNLQLRFPVVVIGGGLTAVDAATESMTYYINFITKIVEEDWKSDDNYIAKLSEEELEILDEYYEHYNIYKTHGMEKFLEITGGVSILYRQDIKNAPSYKLNHEELQHALDQGVKIIDNAYPVSINLDKYKHVNSITISKGYNIAAKAILIAAGTSPNTTLHDEYPELELSVNSTSNGKLCVDPVLESSCTSLYTASLRSLSEANFRRGLFKKSGKYFDIENKFFTYISDDKSFSISVLGDANKDFAGNVVKAMASGKEASPVITEFLYRNANPKFIEGFLDNIKALLSAKIVAVNILSSAQVELIIHAPLAAQNFQPGQFYRLQSFDDLKMGSSIEPVALTGAWVNKDKGIISTIILEIGTSTKLCRYLKPGQEIIFMGPTGSTSFIPKNKNVLLIGGGLGNAVLYSIGLAMLENGCNVIYASGYRKIEERYNHILTESASNVTIWACDEGLLEKYRENDFSYHGNIIDALLNYSGKLDHIEEVLVIGSDRMMRAVSESFKYGRKLAQIMPNAKDITASINSPMQCMMKEICAQCLQEHIDPVTGEKYYVYSCKNQDQDTKYVNFDHLAERLKQNSLLEKYTR